MKNFGTLDMTREELEKYFNTTISRELFDYMSKLDWRVQNLLSLAGQGNQDATDALERKAVAVQETWEYAISGC